MILADVFKNSDYARHSDFSTNAADDPVVVQFAANNGADLAAAAELVAPYAGGIGAFSVCQRKNEKDNLYGLSMQPRYQLRMPSKMGYTRKDRLSSHVRSGNRARYDSNSQRTSGYSL